MCRYPTDSCACGGAEHLPHNNGVIAVFVAPVDGRHLIVDVHRDGKRHRRRFGRRLRIIGRGTHIRVVEQRVPCVFTHDAIHAQRVLLLECLHRIARVPQKIAADVAGIVPQFRQAGLHELGLLRPWTCCIAISWTNATVGAGVGVVVSSERCIPGVGEGVGVAAADESRLMASPLNRRSSVCTSASPVIGRASPSGTAGWLPVSRADSVRKSCRVVAQRHQANLRLPHVLAHAPSRSGRYSAA